LTVADGEEVVVVATVEPAHTHVHIAYRVGYRHPLTKGASGLAILAGRPAERGDRGEVAQARRRGFASTFGELTPGTHGIATPIIIDSQPADASIGVVGIGRLNVDVAAPRLLEAAKAISTSLS
jgi:DNA-binding IclR family transcriptional regulator